MSAVRSIPLVAVSEQRSRTMRAVRSHDTKPEMAVRRLLHRLGYRYRLHRRDLPGTPDIVFGPRRKVIFVHGCFWHGHSCPRGARLPATNVDYWRRKIDRNVERHAEQTERLRATGWATLVIWECQTAPEQTLVERLRAFLSP